jgi:hypothetical protein
LTDWRIAVPSDRDADAGDAGSGLREVRNRADLAVCDGRLVAMLGRYRSVAAPQKGEDSVGAAMDHAVLCLEDGTEVYLEPIDSDRAIRSAEERRRFEGAPARAVGTAHRKMPTRGAAILAPCLSGITKIAAA